MILSMVRDPQVGQTVRFMPDRAVPRTFLGKDFTIAAVVGSEITVTHDADGVETLRARTSAFFLTSAPTA